MPIATLSKHRAIQVIAEQLKINQRHQGEEFYRQPYDLALHIWHALDGANLMIVEYVPEPVVIQKLPLPMCAPVKPFGPVAN